MAIKSKPVSVLYRIRHNTDRGNEFKNRIIEEALETFDIKRSLSHKGCPYDNAVAEATYKIIKTEFAFNKRFENLRELERELFDYVNWYNNVRINSSLDYIFNLCKKLFPKFIHQDIKTSDLGEFNSTVAEIRWILAHSTPWLRGSDAISNVFMRAMYKAAGIKTYPLIKGTSLDLEAYCTELSEYKKKFPAYFEKPPEIIE